MQMTNGNANQQQQHQQHQQQSQQQGDWSTSFEGIGARPFSDRAIDILLAPVADQDIEVKPGMYMLILCLRFICDA